MKHSFNWLAKTMLLAALLACLPVHGRLYGQQAFKLSNNQKRASMSFKFVRNMMVVQLRINHKGPYNFILDTGVGAMIITDPKLADSVNLYKNIPINLSGLAQGASCQAYIASGLQINMGDSAVVATNMAAAIFKEDYFGLTAYAGMPIHGLLGYDFFNSFAVKINFDDSTLTVGQAKNIRIFRKAAKVDIHVEDDLKPYINTQIRVDNGQSSNCKLVIDLGAGHPLLIERITQNLPTKVIEANLGVGLSGPLRGFIGRVTELEISRFKIKDIITSFPVNDQASAVGVARNGNLGMEILKKFNLVIDYPDSVMYLKPNMFYRDAFVHDMSGLEYFADGPGLNHIVVSRVEPGSAGYQAGVQPGDEIVGINFKPTASMSLEEIDAIFKSTPGRTILINYVHQKQDIKTLITLQKRI